MRNNLIIDGKDAFLTYGVSVAEGAYNDLVGFPALKPVPYNDWHERDGIEPDLSDPKLDAHSVTIPFNVSNVKSGYNAFITAITGGSYHSFEFKELGITKTLRLTNAGPIKSIQGLGKFSLTFSEDSPLLGYSYVAPSSNLLPLGDYFLDNIDLARYGVRILQGTLDSIQEAPAVKNNLKRDLSTINGVIYDGYQVRYKSKTAVLRCLLKAQSSAEFWQNRNALLYDLTRPNSRVLTVTEISKSIPCFYKACNVNSFYPDSGKFWFEFDLELEFYNGVI